MNPAGNIATLIPFSAGRLHPKWRGGKSRNVDGYVRLTAGENRGKYEHRVVMEKSLGRSLSEFPGLEVHHLDFDRSHNCPGNLMLLDEVINKWLGRRTAELRRMQSYAAD